MTGSHSTPSPKPPVSTTLYQASDTIASTPVLSGKRVVFRDGTQGIRAQHINALYQASNYNQDMVMTFFLESFISSRYSLTIRGALGELGMCQAMPLWFIKYPDIFNEEYLTDLDAQIVGCLRLRDRAWRGNNFVGTRPLTYPARHRALEFIEFVE